MDPDVGYMQGMNFIAAIALRIFKGDEALSFVVFSKILQISNWKRMYQDNTPKLFELLKKFRSFLAS